mmetsp:Transcript_97993/g.282663  ORF Transcript_97993/g.282663 Transcript_97993/m.282663 type:complete len:210 (+) Transcript_97993:1702-2331(+)
MDRTAVAAAVDWAGRRLRRGGSSSDAAISECCGARGHGGRRPSEQPLASPRGEHRRLARRRCRSAFCDVVHDLGVLRFDGCQHRHPPAQGIARVAWRESSRGVEARRHALGGRHVPPDDEADVRHLRGRGHRFPKLRRRLSARCLHRESGAVLAEGRGLRGRVREEARLADVLVDRGCSPSAQPGPFARRFRGLLRRGRRGPRRVADAC